MKWWAVAAGLAIIGFVVLADLQRLGPLQFIYKIRYADKLGHFFAFGLLSLFLNLAAFERWPRTAHLHLAVRIVAALAVLMALEEWSQELFPARTATIWDLLAGYAGVAVFTGAALLASRPDRTSAVS